MAYGRVPSNHEWGANGIHHGSFRFELGNPNWHRMGVEGRFSWDNGSCSWGGVEGKRLRPFTGFISITPSAQFAPISHAGQIYEFRANDAFRTGLAEVLHMAERQTLSLTGSTLGQWDLQTGLGLPSTTPSQARLSWEGALLEDCLAIERPLWPLCSHRQKQHQPRCAFGGHHTFSNHREGTVDARRLQSIQPRVA